jgi:hypothetical protein
MKKKQQVRIIKQTRGESEPPPAKKQSPRKKRSLESTVQGWITERRDNQETADRSRNSEFEDWNADTATTETA